MQTGDTLEIRRRILFRREEWIGASCVVAGIEFSQPIGRVELVDGRNGKIQKLWTRVSVLIVPPTKLVLTKCPAYASWTLIFGKDKGWSASWRSLGVE